MSNSSVLVRIETLARDAAEGRSSPGQVAEDFRFHVGALEGVPYPLIREADALANEFQIADWLLDEDSYKDVCAALAPLLARLEAWVAGAREAGPK